MKAHTCKYTPLCCCRCDADEPNWDCPIHGDGPERETCDVCGRFMPRNLPDLAAGDVKLAKPALAPAAGADDAGTGFRRACDTIDDPDYWPRNPMRMTAALDSGREAT